MANFTKQLPHLIVTALVVTVATVALCFGKITASEWLGIVGPVTGVSLGGSVASASGGGSTPSTTTATVVAPTSPSVPPSTTPITS